MSNESRAASSGGIGVGGLLGVLFVGLKLTGHIDWSWLWVTAPFWIPLGVALACVTVLLAVWAVVASVEAVQNRSRRKRRAEVNDPFNVFFRR